MEVVTVCFPRTNVVLVFGVVIYDRDFKILKVPSKYNLALS